MPTPAEILERNAQQAKAAQAGGGKAHEGGGLLADADFETSEESEMVKESNAFWMEKFSLKICGRNLSVTATRNILMAGAVLLCVMAITTAVSLSSSDEGPVLSDDAQALIERSAATTVVAFVVQADSIDAADDEDTWTDGFERDLVDALNDDAEGLPSLFGTQYQTTLVMDPALVEVGTIVDADSDTEYSLPCEGDVVDAREVQVYFSLEAVKDGSAINRVFSKQRPSRSTWCTTGNALKRGEQSRSIIDINFAIDPSEDRVDSLRAGNGRCTRSGTVNCGEHADCVNTDGGHECVCRSGYKRGATATSCVPEAGGSFGTLINEGRQVGDYATPESVQLAFCPDGTACAGTTTWRLQLKLNSGAQDVYALFGQSDHALDLPPAYQAPTPFGVNVGGVNPLLFTESGQHRPEFDSWVTIGMTEGTLGQVTSVGIDWDCWQFDDVEGCDDRGGGIHITDGAIFYMDPLAAPDGVDTRECPGRSDNRCPIVVAQITKRQEGGSVDPVRLGAQGHHTTEQIDNWKDYPCWCFGDADCINRNIGCDDA